MNVVLPMLVMVFFGVLYGGAYVWMRHPKFGESEMSSAKDDSRSMTALSNPTDDYPNRESSLPNARDWSGPSQRQVAPRTRESM